MDGPLVLLQDLVLPLEDGGRVLHGACGHLVPADLAHFIEKLALVLLGWDVLERLVFSALQVECIMLGSFGGVLEGLLVFGRWCIEHIFLFELNLGYFLLGDDSRLAFTVLNVDLDIHVIRMPV